MSTQSLKTWTGVSDGTLATAAPAETGSALTKSSLSEEGGSSAGTAVINNGSVIPGESSGQTGYLDDATPLGSNVYTAHAKHYHGDHGNGLASVYIRKDGSSRYEVLWVNGSTQYWLQRNGSTVATAGASGHHDQVLDYYLEGASNDNIRFQLRRPNGDYWNGTSWGATPVYLFDYTDGSPNTAIGTSGFGYRLAAHTNAATRQRVEAWDIDGTAPSADSAQPEAIAPVETLDATSAGGDTQNENLTAADTVSATVTAGAQGSLITEPLVRNNGTLAANSALDYLALYNKDTGALVIRKTGLTTNASAIAAFTDPAVVQGVEYKIDWQEASGQRRMPHQVAE